MLDKEKAQQFFNESFKFGYESLRHKGDKKGRFESDMGLFTVKRILVESINSEGEVLYEKMYHCRMIRFSGSGDLQSFDEGELLTETEYYKQQVETESKHDHMRNEQRQVEKEIYKLFGVTKDTHVWLKKDGVTDNSREFRPTGFGPGSKLKKFEGQAFDDDRLRLILTEVYTTLEKDAKRDTAYVASPDEFEVIP